MNRDTSIAPIEAPENRTDCRKSPRLRAQLLDRGPLSPKEAQVLTKLAEGLSKKQIAQRVNRSLSTINTQLEHIYRKLGAHSATHAIGIAVSKGIVGLSILTLLVAIQVDNKNLIRPRNPIRTGRTASARSRRETDAGIGSDATSTGNYQDAAMCSAGFGGVFDLGSRGVVVGFAGEGAGKARPVGEKEQLNLEAAQGSATQQAVV